MQQDEEVLCRDATARATEALAKAYVAINEATFRCFELRENRASVRYSINTSHAATADTRRAIETADRILRRSWSPPRGRENAPN